MPPGWPKSILAKALLQLSQRVERLSPKSPELAAKITAMSELYGTSVYRAFNDLLKSHAAHRLDHGLPRVYLDVIWNATVSWSLSSNFVPQ